MEVVNLLLQAPSRGAIEQLLNLVLMSRNEPSLNLTVEGNKEHTGITKTIRALMAFPDEVTDAQISQLRDCLHECIQTSLSSGKLEDLAEMFQEEGKDVNPKLKQLLGQIIGSRLEVWKEASSLGRVSLPRLQDFNWSLQFQRASSEVAEMQIPSIIMSLNVESTPTFSGHMSKVETIDVEMSREALETMID
eukprot:gene44260-54125_t